MAELASSVAPNLVSKLDEYLFAPIGRRFGYVLRYNSYIQNLKNGVEKLERARERVRHSVDEAVYGGKPIHIDIEKWLDSVKNKANEAQNLLTQGESARTACFHGWVPNPMVRHRIGRKVKKITRVIQELHDETANNNFQKVYYENPPKGIVIATTSATRSVDKKEDVLESRASITEDVINAITDDKICVVGVYGQGGVGKSKLLEDVERRVKKEKLFDMVAMANVSCNPDLKTIQGEIADALGLNLMNVETARGRADRLRERLECDCEKKILIILDNLWRKLELKDVGIPCGDDNKVRGCKLLLSSRKGEVLRIDMVSDREFQLKELDNREGRRLFERILGNKVYDPDFRFMVDGVVKNCGGLPLFIISLAKRLRRENLAAWRNALTIEGSDFKSLVELNYKDLKDERIQSLFLVCTLRQGRMGNILFYCLGLGLYNNFSKTIEDARDRLSMDLDCLRDSSLLLDSDASSRKKKDSNHIVKVRMHDIVADVANSIASTEWKALVGREDCGFKKWSKAEVRECIAILFPNAGIDELPEKLDCPNLRIFLLYEEFSSLKVPESFFESMQKLQVLELEGISITSLPSSIEFLENLKSLSLAYCHLGDVTLLGKLKALQILHLLGSTIARLPKEIGELTELRILNLKSCTRLKVIEPGLLGNLVNLEELYMADSFDRWEAEHEAPRRNASLTELKNMNKLSTLDIAIPHSADLPRDLPFGKLNKHKIQIGGFWDWSVEYKESRTLKLKLDLGNLLFEECVQRCLQRTQHLHLDGLQDGNDSIQDLCIEGFQELKYLHVQNSPSFHYVVHPANNVQCTAFTRLVSLFLENLGKFEKICGSCLPLESFSKLKIVKVDNCSEMKHLFPSSMMSLLSQLEEIEISRCHLMQQIVADVEVDRDEIYDPNVKSCNLHRLILRNLRKMTSFYRTANLSVDFFDGQQLIKLQNLEAITIEKCQLIREVFDLEGLTSSGEVEILLRLRELTLSDLPSLGRIWNKNPRRALCFRNLRALKVQNCENLRFLFSSSMAKALGQIKEIEIASCKLMEEIIDAQEEELEEAATSDTLEFPLLISLSLEELPNLKTFSYQKYCIHCPSLTKLTISRCPKMMTFSSLEAKQWLITSDRGLQQAFDCRNSGLSLPGFFNEKVLFPSLEELKLFSMCQLKKIWHNQLHGKSFYKLASLTVELCENLFHVFPSNSIDRLQSLNKIEVVGCPSLETLFDPVSLSSNEMQKPLVLSSLEKMKLLNLPKLTDILKSDCKLILAFPSLWEVSVSCCHSLSYLFSSATARTLDKLVVLDVSCCNNMKGIIAMEEGTVKTIETFKFRNLSTLKLGDLEDLICFNSKSCAGDGLHPLFDDKLAFPKLEELHIKGVQQKELWNDKIRVESFCRLKVLEVKQCHNLINVIPSSMWKRLLHCMESLTIEKCQHLRNLFTMTMAKSLGQLQYLSLSGCGEMEYIVTKEEEKLEEAADKIVIPQLVTLHLHNMPKLRSFFQGKHISKWPSLKEFTIQDCKAVEVILGDASHRKLEGGISIWQPLLLVEKLIRLQNLEAITVERCQLIREVFDLEELTTSGDVKILWQLTRLTLSGLPKLERIWNKNPKKSLCFQNLKALKVQNCESLRFLFSSSMVKALVQIKEIEIASCALMEEIMYVQEEELEEAMTTDTVEFPLLTSLSLEELPNLKIFSYGKYYIHCPSLTRLTISGCPKMMTFSSFKGRQQSMTAGTGLQQAYGCINSSLSLPGFFNEKVLFPSLEELKLSSMCQLKRIWHNQLQGQSFCKLAALTVELCKNLSHIFPSNSMDMLQSLNKIKVVGCPSLEALFEPISLSTEKRQKPLVLPALRELTFLNLSRLRDFLKSDCKVTLAFPSLMEVKVRDCHSLLYLFSSAMAETLDKLVVLDVSCCNNLRGIIAMEEGKGKTLETFKFHQLSTIKLDDLENLISFYSASCASDGLHPLFDEKVLFPSLEELKLSSMCQLKKIWHNQIHGQSFCKLASLTIKLCENLSHVFPSNIADRLPSLNKIEVVGCPSLEALFEPVSLSSEKRQKPLVLLALREMTLLNLSRLRDILKSDCKVTLAFPSLMEVNVRCCHGLSYLFSSAMAKTLHELAVLDVSCCNNLRSIIEMEEGKGKTLETFKFPHLTKLKLDDLKSLICFSLESCAGDGLHPLFDEKLAFPKLEELHVEGVQHKEIWNDKIHVESFCLLKVLKVKQCHNLVNVIPSSMWKRLLHCMESLTVEKCQCLRNLFTMSMAKSLGQLQYLGLSGCGEIEYIVAKEEEKPEEATNKIIIPQLVALYLHNMPKLRSFYQGKHISKWPSLKEFTIEDCKTVKVILGYVSCRKLEGSVPTHQPLLLIEKVEFPALESMKILHMENMEKIWLDDLDSNAFGKLKTLVVEHCEKLLSIFSSYNVLTRFQNLEKITVTDCGSLEVAFQVQEFEFSEACSTNSFQLGEIVLTRLPKMKHVWNGLPQGGLTFGRLQCMKVVKCESLKILFPTSVAKNMTQFKELLVRDCGVEEIIAEKDRLGMSASDLFFPKLTDLRLLELLKLGSFYRNSHTSAWPLLKQLRVRHCGKMRSFLFACEFQGRQGTTINENQSALFSFEKVIPHLEGFTLSREDVAMIPQHYVFHNLKELALACYHDENVAFPSNFLLHRFPNLEVLAVICSSFEEIFSEDLSGHGGATPCGELTDMAKPLQELRNVNRLDLHELRNLKRVWKDGSLMTEILKQIEVLWVEECPRLPIVLPSPISFQRLTHLAVEDCSGLVHMGTCSAATSLVHLTWLFLRNCGAMEDVVTDDGNGVRDINFPKLEKLTLDGLPSLESFSNTYCALRFPLLVRTVVTKCPKMNVFCKGALRTPNLNEVLLSEEDDEGHWEDDLNTTIQTLFALNDPQQIQ